MGRRERVQPGRARSVYPPNLRHPGQLYTLRQAGVGAAGGRVAGLDLR